MRYGPLLLLFALPVLAIAYDPIVARPAEQYAYIPIEGDPYVERHYLGNLAGVPDLYELRSDVAFDLTLTLKQRASDTPIPLSLIVVKDLGNNGGVEEVMRQSITAAKWQPDYHVGLAIPFLNAPTVTTPVEPGTYRIEVSTPTNSGPYMLVVGEESTWTGPYKMFKAVFMTQDHFGIFFLFRLLSPYVLIPFMLVIMGIIWLRRQWQNA